MMSLASTKVRYFWIFSSFSWAVRAALHHLHSDEVLCFLQLFKLVNGRRDRPARVAFLIPTDGGHGS